MMRFEILKTGRSLLFAGALLLSSSCLTPPALAQTPADQLSLFSRAARPPEISEVPVLSNLVRAGARLFYIGERSGLHGWFIMKDGQIQIIYVTGDGKTSIVGGMFTGDGQNVTGAQIRALSETNKEVAALMNDAGVQQGQVTRVGGVVGGVASVPGDPAVAKNGTSTPNGLPGVVLSPGERLYQDLQAAAGVVVGHNDKAEVFMVMDVNCGFCRETWRKFRDYVSSDRVQIRLIPITLKAKSDNTRAGARLLEAADPYATWDKYVNGDKSALAGVPDDVHVRAVLANRELADRWNIRATPYLVYRGRDGRVKIVQGEPNRVSAILSDLIH